MTSLVAIGAGLAALTGIGAVSYTQLGIFLCKITINACKKRFYLFRYIMASKGIVLPIFE